MVKTLPTEPGSKTSLTTREVLSLALSLPASIWSVSSRARMSPVLTSATTAMAHEALYLSLASSSAFLTYQSTSLSTVRDTSDPFTASFDSVSVPGISSPPRPCWYTSYPSVPVSALFCDASRPATPSPSASTPPRIGPSSVPPE